MEEPIKDLDKLVEVKKSAITNWFKEPENILLSIILTLAFILRFYIFLKTLNQPVWWDEGEYASGALHWAIGTPSALAPIRELVLPFIFSLLYRIYPGEFLWRTLELFISITLVVGLYFCTKELFDKKTALIATFFITCNSLIIFYSGRLLTYIIAPVCLSLILLFFYKGYVQNKGTKYLIYSTILFTIGFLAYWSVFLAVPIILIFLLLTDKFKFIKSKPLWISVIVGGIPLVIYFIISKINTGIIYPRLSQVAITSTQSTLRSPFIYVQNFPQFFGWLWIIFFIFGLLALIKIFISFDLIIKGNSNNNQKSRILIFIWFFIVLAFFSYIYAFKGSPYWETFLFPLFPAFGIISAIGFMSLKDISSKIFDKKITIILLIILLLIAGGSQILKAQNIVNSGLNSFGEIKIAGEWLKQNTAKTDVIFSSSLPQLTYSSERKVIPLAREENDTMKRIKEENGKYFIISPFDFVPDWEFNLPQKYPNLFIPVHVIYSISNPKQPMVGIYMIKNDNITNNTNI